MKTKTPEMDVPEQSRGEATKQETPHPPGGLADKASTSSYTMSDQDLAMSARPVLFQIYKRTLDPNTFTPMTVSDIVVAEDYDFCITAIAEAAHWLEDLGLVTIEDNPHLVCQCDTCLMAFSHVDIV